MKKKYIIVVAVGIGLLIESLYMQVSNIECMVLWMLPLLYAATVFLAQCYSALKRNDYSKNYSLSNLLFMSLFIAELPILYLYQDRGDEFKLYVSKYIMFICAVIVFRFLLQLTIMKLLNKKH